MELLNFYTSGSSTTHHKSIRRWFVFNCCIVAITSSALLGLAVFQKHTHSILQKEKSTLEQHIAAANPLLQHQRDFQNAQALMNKKRHESSATSTAQLYSQILTRIKHCSQNDIVLESISAQTNGIEIQVSSTSANSVLEYVQAFCKHPQTRDFYITALENKNNNRFVAIIKNN